nr:hypothetical protein [Tanacetum cinerariifolium]
MSSLFADTQNVVAILKKSDAAEGFEQIIDFLSRSYIHYSLTVSPHIYISCIKQFWNFVSVKRSGDVTRLQALVDKKKIVISEKVFANMPRVRKGFSGVETPLFEKEVVAEVVPPTPTSSSPPSPVIPSSPPHQPPCPPQSQDAEVPSLLFQWVLDTCSALARRVEGLETDKAAQQLEIVKLKTKVKKLEKINLVKSSKLRRLKKVGTSQRVKSLDDMENVFNQDRKIADMDQDEGIELVADQEKDAEVEGRHVDKQAELYNLDQDHSSKVLSMQEDDTEVQEDVEIVNTAKLITEVVTAAATQAVAATPKPMKKKDQIEMDAEYAMKLQEEINKEHEETYKNINWNDVLDHNTEGYKMDFFKGMKYDEILPIFQDKFDANMRFSFKSREEMEAEDQEIIKSINETPAQKAAKRRKLSEEAQEAEYLRKRLEVVEDKDDDVFVEATPLAQKLFLLFKRRYPLSRFKLEQLVNVARLQVEEESEMSLELLRFTRQQLQEYQQG